MPVNFTGMEKLLRVLLTVTLVQGTAGCGIIKSKPADEKMPIPGVNSPALGPEQAEQLLTDVGEGWVFGEGLGDTALQVGTALAFPPYALVLLGNGILSISGYEPVTVSGLLPEEAGTAWKEAYSDVVSVPGKVTAAAAGKEFRTPERVRADIQRYLQPQSAGSGNALVPPEGHGSPQ